MPTTLPEILVVEDNPHDVELLLHALRKSNASANIQVLRDGAEALDYFFGTTEKAPADLTGLKLILIDVKLPKADGLEVLKTLKAAPRTRLIPVVMLSTSSSEQDMTASYQLGANSYIVKPVDFTEFVEEIRCAETYWMRYNRLPLSHLGDVAGKGGGNRPTLSDQGQT